jgi:hypothetical protein
VLSGQDRENTLDDLDVVASSVRIVGSSVA